MDINPDYIDPRSSAHCNNISVLIVSESKNPYVSEIANSLSGFFQVNQSIRDFLEKKGNYDIIHIQWPEEITAWSVPSDAQLDEVQNALRYWQKKAKIIVTRHNVLPNKANPLLYTPLYELVYSYADAVVHLGQRSLNDFHQRYSGKYKKNLHRIIPHHIYESYPNNCDCCSARKYLRIPKKKLVVLCFGNIRSPEQFRRVFKAYKALDLPDKCLLVPRYKETLYSFRFDTLKRFKFILQQWYYKIFFNVLLNANFIKSNEVQYYFNAADVVFISRSEQLNSGIIFLALAFKKVLTGPAKGNMEEVIRYFGYPAFNPKDDSSVAAALKQSVHMAKGKINPLSEVSLERYSLRQSIDKHKELYLHLLSNNKKESAI